MGKKKYVPSIQELFDLFTQVNKDIAKDANGEGLIDLDDADYYAEQIFNLYEVDWDTAAQLANDLADFVNPKRNS